MHSPPQYIVSNFFLKDEYSGIRLYMDYNYFNYLPTESLFLSDYHMKVIFLN